MPITPSALERLLVGRLNLLPGLLLDYAGALAFRAVVVATRAGVFEALRQAPLSPAEVAARTSRDAAVMSDLWKPCAPSGTCGHEATDTSSPRLTRRWLLDDAADSLVRGLQFLEWNAFDGWSELEPVLRAGLPRRPLYERLEEDPAASRAFQAWDLVAARLTARRSSPVSSSRPGRVACWISEGATATTACSCAVACRECRPRSWTFRAHSTRARPDCD